MKVIANILNKRSEPVEDLSATNIKGTIVKNVQFESVNTHQNDLGTWHQDKDGNWYLGQWLQAIPQMSGANAVNDWWIKVSDADIAKIVLKENAESLRSMPNVLSVGLAHDNNGNKIIEVAISDNNRDLIQDSYPYHLPNNTVRQIPVHVITTSEIKTQAAIGFGQGITNRSRPNYYGSYGLAVKFRNTTTGPSLFLSCYHVVIGLKHDYASFRFQNDEQVILKVEGQAPIVGSIRNAVRNQQIDAAIVQTADGISISNSMFSGARIQTVRNIANDENCQAIKVTMEGYLTKTATGTIQSINNAAKITYLLPNGSSEQWELTNLISISNDGKSISVPGDSGAAVIDDNHCVVGIVVGGSDTLTYAIPIQTIFNQLNIELA